MRFLRACLAVAVLALSLALPAQAFAEVIATSTTTSIDASPFLVNLASLVSTAFIPFLGSLAFVVVMRLKRLVGVQTTAAEEAALRASIEQGLERSIGFARARAGTLGPIPIDLKNPAIADAAGYAIRSIPDALAKIGILDAASERLAEMIEARFSVLPPAVLVTHSN